MDWISAHHQIISLIISGLTLLVWMFYAHLLLNNYRRQRRAKVLINQGLGGGVDSRCLVCNMSEEAVYVALVIAELETDEGCWECSVTDYGGDQSGSSLFELTTQGPLKSGDFRDVGTFRALINRVLASHDKPELDENKAGDVRLYRLSLHIVSVYVSEDSPVGASRHFLLDNDDNGCRLRPTRVDTERLSSPKQRRRVAQWLRRYL